MEKNDNIEFADQVILPVNMENEVKTAFIDYSMSVIMSRALPDVRDGMKPGQRRILWAMYEDKLTYDKPFRKSATTVGNVLGHYHPHGDSSVYQTMVRMAQPFSMRHTLIEGHGNFGNVDGDGAAAYRYTEARLSRIADCMMRDIDKDVVDFVPNFDNKLKEPVVLPSRFPNLLVNGSVGIAVGMATYIPTHNLGEVIDGTVYFMDHPDAQLSEIMQYIKGPDFPTYATIYGTAGIYQAYATGRGHVNVRAKATVEEDKHRIIITEIPFGVNKSLLVESIADMHRDKRVEGITGLRDESGRGGMRIVIEYRRDANGQVILNQLYKNTQLQDTCAINLLALVNNEPKTLTLMQILQYYIDFQRGVVLRRTNFELDKALREMHIYEGYKIAIDNIDTVISIIRSSENVSAAKEALINYKFPMNCTDSELFSDSGEGYLHLTDPQAQAIVDMTLGRLSGMERKKVEERLAKLEETVAQLRDLASDPSKISAKVKEELLEIKERFADPRRTEIFESEDDILIEDLIDKHECVLTMTHCGYIKRQPASTYNAQRRGGRGIIGMGTKEEDFIENVMAVHSHDYLMMFTNMGRVYSKKVFMIPEASRTAKGTNIANILELSQGEQLTTVFPVEEFTDGEYLLMVTKRGVVKRTLLSEYEYQRRSGKIALSLDEGDELVFVRHTTGSDELIIATRQGYAVRFNEKEIRAMGRMARGVRGIRLTDGDEVCGVALVEEGKALITITEKGYGKRTPFEDFRTMLNRGGKGVVCHKISDKTGLLSSIASVSDNDDIMMITNEGVIIRTPARDIPEYSRSAGGVIVMRMGEGASIVTFTHTENTETEEETEGDDNDVADRPEQTAGEGENARKNVSFAGAGSGEADGGTEDDNKTEDEEETDTEEDYNGGI